MHRPPSLSKSPRLPRGVSPTGTGGRDSPGSPARLFPHFNTQVLVFHPTGHSLSKHLQAHCLCLGPGRAPARAVPAPSAEVKEPGEGLPQQGPHRAWSQGATRLCRGVTWAAGGAGGNVPRGAEAGVERRPRQHRPPGPSLPPQCPHPRCRQARQCPTGPWAPSSSCTGLLPQAQGFILKQLRNRGWTRALFLVWLRLKTSHDSPIMS